MGPKAAWTALYEDSDSSTEPGDPAPAAAPAPAEPPAVAALRQRSDARSRTPRAAPRASAALGLLEPDSSGSEQPPEGKPQAAQAAQAVAPEQQAPAPACEVAPARSEGVAEPARAEEPAEIAEPQGRGEGLHSSLIRTLRILKRAESRVTGAHRPLLSLLPGPSP